MSNSLFLHIVGLIIIFWAFGFAAALLFYVTRRYV